MKKGNGSFLLLLQVHKTIAKTLNPTYKIN